MMSDPLPAQPASDNGGEPDRLEYIAGPGEAGDAACWAQFVCPDCGAVRSEGTCRCNASRDEAETADPATRTGLS